MDRLATIRRRHASQRLAGPPLESAADAVRWSGAVQAQEFAEVKWSLAERIGSITDAEVQRAFDAGEILRTHVMRPTWHFVAAEDIRWLLRLTAPRVHQVNRHMYNRTGLDPVTLARAHDVIARELEGGRARTRKELKAALAREEIEGDSMRIGYVFGHAELEALVCSGPRRGKQQTYMLLDERAPAHRGPDAEGAAAELARRYFRSHGPATARDFSWWSGLTLTQSRAAIEACEPGLERTDGEDGTPWFTLGPTPGAPARHRALLLPTYDELIVAYKELRVEVAGDRPIESFPTRTVAIDGLTVGGWKRTLSKHAVVVEVRLFADVGPELTAELEQAVARFGSFLGLEPELRLLS